MSDILDRKIEIRMRGAAKLTLEWLTDAEAREMLVEVLWQLSRLTTAIGILCPGEPRASEGAVDCAIRLLEDLPPPLMFVVYREDGNACCPGRIVEAICKTETEARACMTKLQDDDPSLELELEKRSVTFSSLS